jgi:hypothetical protein
MSGDESDGFSFNMLYGVTTENVAPGAHVNRAMITTIVRDRNVIIVTPVSPVVRA